MPIFYLKKGFMGIVNKSKSNENDELECKIIPPVGHKSLKFITSNEYNEIIKEELSKFNINSAANGELSWSDNNNTYLDNLNIMVDYLCIL
jgi:hypothetical protein